MKKSMLSWLSALLCLILVFGSVAALSSCQKEGEGDGGSDSSNAGSDNGGELPKEYSLDLVVGGKSDYLVIIPANPSDDMIKYTNLLLQAFKNYTGATLDYEQDYKNRKSADDAKEILIGATYRPESAAAIEGLGVGEYVIRAEGTRLIINGYAESNVTAAVDYFITNMIKSNSSLKYGATDANFTFTTAQNYLKTATYYIKSIQLLDKKLTDCQIVYPEGKHVEKYIAQLVQRHVEMFAGMTIAVVSDATASTGPEILIGKTNRTTITAEAGQYQITVTEKGVEAVSNSLEGYAKLYTRIQGEVLKYSSANIVLSRGQSWNAEDGTAQNMVKNGDVRVMYHNVWGYLLEDGANTIANRLQVATQVYEEYMPDVIGFQEFANSDDIRTWLVANGYEERVAFRYNPIWFNTNTLECLSWGSENAEGHGYNSLWCIFRVKATGKVFGMCNSHFTADSMVEGQLHENGDIERNRDAQALLKAVKAIQDDPNGGTDIPIFTGGDYNATPTSLPMQTLTNGGLTDMYTEGVATVCSEYAAYSGGSVYDAQLGYYPLAAENINSATNAIDHIMYGGNTSSVQVNEYAVLNGQIARYTSDHCPHFVDFSFR